ncbi:MAG TPA: four helix bundle protein [Vicinamibacterales bacterium]|jgi:four helix bundle protein
MNTIRYYRDLDAWQSAMDLAVAAHNLARTLPVTHRFELAAQIRRSATSIPSNIAEGHAQRGDRILRRHVRIALGSLAELETQLELSVRLNLVQQQSVESFNSQLVRTGQLLNGLYRTLKSGSE